MDKLNQALKVLDQNGLNVEIQIHSDGVKFQIEGVMTEKQIIATAEIMDQDEMEDCVAEYYKGGE